MRVFRVLPVFVLVLFASTAAHAQWMEFVSTEDRFTVNFPGTPAVEEISWLSEYGATFPGRVYSYEDGPRKYGITVIDYTDTFGRHAARTDRTQGDESDMYPQIDVQASIQYAATKLYRQKEGAEVTYDAWHYIDLVEGHQLQLTNADASRTFVGIYLHDNRLYILEATVPPNAPPPGLFQQSLGFLDANGEHVRYNEIYSNQPPPRPGRAGRGQQGQ